MDWNPKKTYKGEIITYNRTCAGFFNTQKSTIIN